MVSNAVADPTSGAAVTPWSGANCNTRFLSWRKMSCTERSHSPHWPSYRTSQRHGEGPVSRSVTYAT